MSMITAASWVPRGFAAPVPTKYELDETELKRIEELARLRLEEATEDLGDAANGTMSDGNDTDDGDGDAMTGSTRSKSKSSKKLKKSQAK